MYRDLMLKYPDAHATRRPSDAELKADLRAAQAIRTSAPESDDAVRAGVIESWIAQTLRMRTPGLNGPLTR
jgi:hypothetical protein